MVAIGARNIDYKIYSIIELSVSMISINNANRLINNKYNLTAKIAKKKTV